MRASDAQHLSSRGQTLLYLTCTAAQESLRVPTPTASIKALQGA